MAGDSLGGSHQSLLGLLQRLDPAQYRVLVVVEREGGRLARHFAEFQVMVDPAAPKRPFAPGRPLGPLKFLSTLAGVRSRARLLREQNVAIVHSNDGRTHATWALAAKLAGARLLWHHRADPEARGLRYVAPLLADQLVTVSRFSLPTGRSSRVLREAQVVFSPFDTDVSADRGTVRRRLLDELDAPENALLCGYFGLFLDRKRPLPFIDAIARLKQMTDRPVFGLMFGEAEHDEIEAAMRQRIASQGLEHSVRLMGYRSPGWEWIAACDVLLVPAVGEPLGRTLVEAMLVGTPIVAARAGGNPEAILEGCGLLVEPDNPAAMAEATAGLLGDPQATAAIVDKARASARERFAASRHVEAITSIYQSLLRK